MRCLTMRFGRLGLVATCVVSGLAIFTAPASAAQDDLDLVSRASGATGAKAEENADQTVISADGRFVAFRSPATNLHPDATDNNVDVFVRDLQENTTTLVSRADGEAGAQGNSTSDQPAISADGRFVAFTSTASNLHPDDTDGTDDVFVRDLQENTTTLVSRADGETGAKSDSQSREPSISSDGTSIAFRSTGANLNPDDTDGTPDLFVRDLTTNTTTLVSRADGAAGAKASSPSSFPAISSDGDSVAFESAATNLDPDDTDSTVDVFVRDIQADTTTLVSRADGANGVKSDGDSNTADISADGLVVSFHSSATNLHPDDTDDTRDVFVRDLQADTTTLVSRADGETGAKGNDESNAADISPNGRFVAFHSAATNLHPDDTDGTRDVFVRDLQAEITALASRAAGATGVKGNGNSLDAVLSADGRYVAFHSTATNLHPDDTDTQNDVFRREVLEPIAPPTTTCANRAATVEGTDASETLRGTAGDDVIVAKAGNDKIYGYGGRDIICGGTGNDKIYGGSGNDALRGEAGNDTLTGGTGADTLTGGSGTADRARYYDHTRSVNATIGNRKNDDGNGSDGPSGARDRIYNDVEGLVGSPGADYLAGNGLSNRLNGAGGDDQLVGSGGNDTLVGGTGNDQLLGGYGRDNVYGGLGADALYGQGDSDFLHAKDNARDTRIDGGLGSDTAYRDAVDPRPVSV